MSLVAGALIAVGYAAVIWIGGWIGLLAVAAHIGIMLLAMR